MRAPGKDDRGLFRVSASATRDRPSYVAETRTPTAATPITVAAATIEPTRTRSRCSIAAIECSRPATERSSFWSERDSPLVELLVERDNPLVELLVERDNPLVDLLVECDNPLVDLLVEFVDPLVELLNRVR